ncbi:MAG: hypothetical protein ACYC2I_01600 [Elusimicrobiales bacterium]
MSKTKDFGALLARIRRERGFASAHRFFKGSGGSKGLGLSFVSYWDIERGKKLPKSWRLKSIMAALGLEAGSPAARDLAREYFAALAGSAELLDLLAPQAAPQGDLPSRELAEAAAWQAVSQRSMNLTLEQWRLRASDMAIHICHIYLVNTTGWVTETELARATGFTPAVLRRALKALAGGGLAELGAGKARSPFTKKVVRPMPATPATAGLKAALNNIWARWLAGARQVDSRRMTFRMTRANLDKYRQHLEKAVSLACLYANSDEDRAASDIYSVETGIYRIFPGAAPR